MSVPWLALVVLLGAIGGTLYFVFGSFLCGAGYQPAFPAVVEQMLTAAEVGPNDLVYDPGAGTGAIVFRAARERGARVVAVEIEPLRVLFLRARRWIGGPRDRVEIRWQDLFEVDYRPATVVAVFLWPEAMHRLQPILESQLRPGARVVSHWHPMPEWTALRVDPRLRVYCYRWEGRAGVTGGG